MDISVSYRDIIFESPAYVDLALEGIFSLPEIQARDLPFSNRSGFLPGVDLARGRTISFSGTVIGFDEASFTQALEDIRYAFEIREFERDLIFSIPGIANGSEVGIGCRPRAGGGIIDINYDNWSATFRFNLFATDPIYYSPIESYQSVNMTTTGATNGHGFDHGFNLGFGSGTQTAFIATNQGNANVWPLIYINGPLVNPHIRNQTDSGDGLSFEIELNTGDTLFIDSARRQVILNGTTNRYDTLLISDWFRILPGNNTLTFQVASSTGTPTAIVAYKNGWL